MLHAYFDDSGTHNDSDVVVVGGLVGTPQQWTDFASAWNAKLASPLPNRPPLRKFGLADCNSGKGEFINYSLAERDAVMHDFRQILVEARLIGTASAIDRKAWESLVVGPYLAEHGSALEQCVQNCVMETLRIAIPHDQGDEINIFFDEGIWTERIRDLAVHFTLPLGRPRVVLVDFLKVVETMGLQGADTIATENYWYAREWLRSGEGMQPRPHMRHFLTQMRTQGYIVERDLIVSMLNETDARWATSCRDA